MSAELPLPDIKNLGEFTIETWKKNGNASNNDRQMGIICTMRSYDDESKKGIIIVNRYGYEFEAAKFPINTAIEKIQAVHKIGKMKVTETNERKVWAWYDGKNNVGIWIYRSNADKDTYKVELFRRDELIKNEWCWGKIFPMNEIVR